MTLREQRGGGGAGADSVRTELRCTSLLLFLLHFETLNNIKGGDDISSSLY